GVPSASGTPASAGRSGLARKFESHTLSLTLLILLAVICASGPVPAAPAPDAKAINGITEPFMDVTLGASVAGIVHTEFFKEGDVVKKGDVILELDKRLEELEVERRTAVMTQNKMQLDSTRALVRTTKSVSTEELAKKEAEYNISAAERGIAAEQLAHRQIVAPFSGAITEIQLHPGAACAPYQPLVRLVDTTRCYFVGQIEGNAVSNLQLDQTVKIEVDGHLAPVTGKICFISPVVDPASGLAKVKALFENADGKIRPGVTAKMAAE
ncbi:MAG: rane fusion protein multidrug efflux system, partial [Verrucomicrobiota bacterium]